MAPRLTFNQYGKTDIRLTQVVRDGSRHELTEVSVQILFQGDFERSYRDADNSMVLPTDTMKNTVYVLARRHAIDAIETFARELAAHFLEQVERLESVEIMIEQMPWARISGHDSAFVLRGKERRITKLTASRQAETIVSGFQGLEILKTANSAFSGFLRDAITTLTETEDRLLGTVLDAEWTYGASPIDFNAEYARLRANLLDTFAGHVSRSVQHTLYEMASTALKVSAAITEVHLVMPNKHRLLFDLRRFGLDNPNQVFVATDQPSGFIEARVVRE